MEENEVEGKEETGKKRKSGILEFISVGEVFGYFFRRKNKDRVDNVNIRIMHFINRLAIVVFLGGVIYLVLRRFL